MYLVCLGGLMVDGFVFVFVIWRKLFVCGFVVRVVCFSVF